MDRLAFARLRTDPQLAATQCVVLSSVGDRQSGIDELDIAAWLSKPVRQGQLLSGLARVTGLSSGWNAAVGERRPASSEASATSGQSILDPAGLGQLIELFDGDASAVIESYLEDSAEQLQLATNALRDDDRTALARSVHSLKSSSRSLGAHVVASIAEEMELLARSGEGTEKLEPLLMRLRQALIQVEPRLRESAGGGDRRASA